MIDWNFFDKIYCIHNTSNNNLVNIKNQLSKIDLLDKVQFLYCNNNVYNTCIFWSNTNYKKNNNMCYLINDENFVKDIDYDNITIKNINEIILFLDLCYQAKLFEYKRILIINDNISFTDDINKISSYINNIPSNYDIINFTPQILNNECTKINDYYHEYDNTVSNTFMISLNNNVICDILDYQEKFVTSINLLLHHNKQFKKCCVNEDIYTKLI